MQDAVESLIDTLRARVNIKNHPYFKELTRDEILGFKKACEIIAIELQHAINENKQNLLIQRRINYEESLSLISSSPNS